MASCPHCSGNLSAKDLEGWVPKERFDELNETKKELAQSNKALSADLDSARKTAALAEKHAERAASIEAEFSKAKAYYSAEVALVEHGIDPDVRQHFFDHYSQIEGDDKPKFGEWLSAAKEDPTTLPKILQPFIPTAQPEPAATAEPEPYRFARRAPATTNTTTPEDHNSAHAISAALRQNGRFDVEAYRNNRDAIRQAAGIDSSVKIATKPAK